MKTYWPALKLGGLILMSAALLPSLASAQDASVSAPVSSQDQLSPDARTASGAPIPMTSVARVEVSRTGAQTTVQVQGSGAELSYHVTRMSNPPRVVVDFDDARLAVNRNMIPSEDLPVERVRLGQSRPGQVRLVIDLAHPAEFSVERSGLGLVVTFADTDSGDGAKAAVAPVSATKISGTKISETGAPAKPANDTIAALHLPAEVTGTAPALASPAPQTNQAASAAASLRQATSQASAQAPAVAQAAGANPVPGNAPAQQQMIQMSAQPVAPSASQPGSQYTGEPISVNLKDVDLKDFFRLIHEISGLNVVLDPSVHGTVTLVLDEVPWDQALDIVLRNNGLSKVLDGNVLRIVSEDTLKKEANDRRDLVKAQSDAVQPVMITRQLSYAKAKDLATPLKRFLTSRGDVTAIDATNTLIIRDVPDSIPQIDNLLRQLDQKTKQVDIEARIVQATRDFARDVGSQFGFAVGQTGPQSANIIGGPPTSTFASPISHTTGPAPPLIDAGTTSIPLVSNLPANAPTSGFSFSHVSPNFALDYVLTAAESKGIGKVLSSPHVPAQNNATAEVKQGEQIPIQTTINNTISVQYVDAVLRLQVTPQITADGTILMDVLVENTQVDNGVPLIQGIPALSTQSVKTRLLIGDGETKVIGGVMVTQQQTSITQVPLVGSIPVIGHLFKETSVTVSSQELLFFLTPRILPG